MVKPLSYPMIRIWISHNNGKEREETVRQIAYPTSLRWPPQSGHKLGVSTNHFQLGKIEYLLKIIFQVTKLKTSISRSTKLRDSLVGFRVG